MSLLLARTESVHLAVMSCATAFSRRSRAAVVCLAVLLAASGCARRPPEPVGSGGRGPTPYYPTAPRPSGPPVAGSGLIDQRIDGATLERVGRDGEDFQRCMATLAQARVELSPVPDRAEGGCELTQAGRLVIDRGTVARLSPAAPEMACETALAFSIWRRQSVEPAAREIFGQDVVQIDLMGTYSCRTVGNRPGGRISAHGRGNAVDFGGVRLRDGRRISVLQNWQGDSDEARFLKRVRDDACRIFGTVLSPEYNAAHRDHLHLEVQETDWTMCR